MKKYVLIVLIKLVAATVTLSMISGCSSTANLSGLNNGSDAAYVNTNRSRPEGEISKAQAEQYSRQRQQVTEEMNLEKQKRRDTLDSVNDYLKEGQDLVNFGRQFLH